MEACALNGRALHYASDRLKKKKNFVCKLLARNGKALEYALPEFREDQGIVLEAIRQNGEALEFAGAKLRENSESFPKLQFEAAKQSGLLWERSSERDFVLR
eukprot:88585-Amphidinium_carterae.1